MTSIGRYTFSQCSNLISVTIPNSVTSIEDCAFSECSKLERINVDSENTYYASIDGILYNKDITTILRSPSQKVSVTIPNSVTTIEDFAFENCSSLTSVTIPNSVTSIGYDAFYGCSSLTSVTIPNTVTEIKDETFYGCSSLTSVTIPNSVTVIGEWAFKYCYGLTSVTIPNSVTYIMSDAFYGCDELKKIYIQCEIPIKCSSEFSDDVLMYAVLYVPTGTKSIYEKVYPWKNFCIIKEMDFSGIENIVVDKASTAVYTLDGILVRRAGDTTPLPAGTYVTKGHKFIVVR